MTIQRGLPSPTIIDRLSDPKPLVKSILYRTCATVITFIAALCMSGSKDFAISFSIIDFFLKLMAFYSYELMWTSYRNKFKENLVVKVGLYRVIATILSLIVMTAVNGVFLINVGIELVTIAAKFLIQFTFEKIWSRVAAD